MSAALEPKRWFSPTGHALLRFSTAHLIDPVTALLVLQADLAASRQLTDEDEAERFLQSRLRFHKGRTYRAGSAGVYVCEGNRVITYIDQYGRFRSWTVRGAQQSRGARLR